MGFFSIELTDYNGKKFYNVTTDKWLREYPEDYKNYIKKTWEVKEHRMYKLIALMDERDSYMIGLLNVFQATLARDLNDKDYRFVAKLIEVQRRRVYREDIYLGLLFAYMHRQTRKAIYKMVFSDDIDKYDEESLRTVLVFAGNFIDITEYLKPGEVIPESVYLEANKKFFDTFVGKDKFWEDFLVEGSIKANGTEGGEIVRRLKSLCGCYYIHEYDETGKKAEFVCRDYDYLTSSYRANTRVGDMIFNAREKCGRTSFRKAIPANKAKESDYAKLGSTSNFGYGILSSLTILVAASGEWAKGPDVCEDVDCFYPDEKLIATLGIPIGYSIPIWN